MGSKKSGHSGCCPKCGQESNLVHKYGFRKVAHYAIGKMETLIFETVSFRCANESCLRKTFIHVLPVAGSDEVVGRSRYTKSSKEFAAHKLLKKQISYNSFCGDIKADFGGKTSLSTLHRWVAQTPLSAKEKGLSSVKVLHTDEKHPSKKKRKSDKKFVIASAGRVGTLGKSEALHVNLADSNGKAAIQSHYNELIEKGLDAEKVEIVVTDMLPAYDEVIAATFPNAVHQYCIFHLIQAFNKLFKAALKEHRTETYAKGERKEAHKTSFLLLKGQEKLTENEQETVANFCQTNPSIAVAYAFKEDVRTLYASVRTPEQAYAYKDILVDLYQNSLSESMKIGLEFILKNFEKSTAFLQNGYFLDRTNNDAERLMRTIKRTQQTHYFLRKDENYIRKIRVVLGILKPVAA